MISSVGLRLGLVVSVAACGRVGFEPLTDSGTGNGASPFGAPVRVAELLPTMSDPVVTADLRTIYMSHNLDVDVWVATRPSADAAWDTPAPVPNLTAAGILDTTPTLARDGTVMWLSHGLAGGPTDVWVATQTGGVWSSPQAIPELAAPANDSPGSVFDGDLQIAFTSRRSGKAELYTSRRNATTSPWMPAAPIAELNDGVLQAGPHVIESGLRVYFAADRGQGHLDLYVAERADLASPFSAPRPLAELNTSAVEDDAWVSADERTILFTSDRGGANGIYMATRQ